MKSINPYDLSLLGEYPEWTEAQVAEAIALSHQAFLQWRRRVLDDRLRKIARLGALLRRDKEPIARLMSQEMGKVIQESLSEVEKSARLCDYYVEHAPLFLAARHVKTEMRKSYVAYQPLGSILAVMPWNFPLWQVMRAAVPALAAGNVMLLKHASNVQGTALMIEKLFLQAGFPVGVFKTLVIGARRVADVLKAPTVAGVALTGSEKAGAAVASIAGSHIKRQVLELGGSDPFIVMDDADLKAAANVAVASRFLNTGQSCIAAKRFIVHATVHDDFLSEVEARLKRKRIGDPLADDTEIGPMARLDLADTLESQLRRGLDEGAELVTGGERDRCLFEPTLVTLSKPDNALLQEEVFGPLMPVVRFETDEEAIRMANDTRFGLGGSVWTKDLEKGEHLALQIEAGSVFVNGLVRSDPRLPFGGIKDSGYGRELSEEGIREFVNVKTVVID